MNWSQLAQREPIAVVVVATFPLRSLVIAANCRPFTVYGAQQTRACVCPPQTLLTHRGGAFQLSAAGEES